MVKLIAVPLLSVFMVWSLYVVNDRGSIQSLGVSFVDKAKCISAANTFMKSKDALNKEYLDSGRHPDSGMGMVIDRFGCANVEWRPEHPSYVQ